MAATFVVGDVLAAQVAVGFGDINDFVRIKLRASALRHSIREKKTISKVADVLMFRGNGDPFSILWRAKACLLVTAKTGQTRDCAA